MMLQAYRSSRTPKTRPGSGLSTFMIFIGVMLWATGISYATETKNASSEYLNPMELHYGALNSLSGINREDLQVAIEMNFDRMSDILNPDFKVTIEFVPDAQTAAELIQQKKLHALSITGIDYLLLNKLADVTPIFVASKLLDSPLEPYVLLTRKGISLDQLLAMDQRRLIMENDNAWDIGRIWLETVLHEKKLSQSNHFFTSIQVATKPMRIVLPIFFGQAEACLVPKSAYDTMVELNPQIGQKLHVLLRSPGFVKNLICIADFLDPGLVDEMKTSLRKLHTTEHGRQLLVVFQLRRNYPFRPEYLVETERIYHKYQKIMLSGD